MTSSVRPLGPTIKPVISSFFGSFTVPVFKTMISPLISNFYFLSFFFTVALGVGILISPFPSCWVHFADFSSLFAFAVML